MNLSEVIDIDHDKFCDVLKDNFQKFYDCELNEEIWDEQKMLDNP